MSAPFVTLLASAARTVTGTGDTMNLVRVGEWPGTRTPQLRVQLDVTAASGTSPTMTVLIEDSVDGVNFNTVGTFVAATAAGRQVINVGVRGDAYPAGFAWPFNPCYVRARWTIGGTTPSFTASVKAILI